MELQYIKNDAPKKDHWLHQCPYNEGCRCRTMNCYSCGWNPKVAKARSQKILAEMGK